VNISKKTFLLDLRKYYLHESRTTRREELLNFVILFHIFALTSIFCTL